MHLHYNYRLYPNKSQDRLMRQTLGNCRWVWNHFLNLENEYYAETKKFRFAYDNAKFLPNLKKEYEWLSLSPSMSLQIALQDLARAMRTYSRNKKTFGFPKFKKKKEFQGSFGLCQEAKRWKYDNKKIKIPKLGWMKWAYSRDIPSEFQTVRIILDGDKWYISIIVKIQEENNRDIHSIVGLDLNSQDLVVTSDGESLRNPKFFKKSKNKLKKIQRQFAKTKKGSNRRKRKQLQLRKVHKKIRDQRKDHLHKISSQIVNDYDFIGLETLNVKAMQKFNGSMIQDAGWSMLVSMIEYKAKLRGKTVQKIDKFVPSSKTCNSCGWKHLSLTLSDRIFNCDSCGLREDRDANAAKNIRDWSLRDAYTAGAVEIYGRGDTTGGVLEFFGASYVSLNRQEFLRT